MPAPERGPEGAEQRRAKALRPFERSRRVLRDRTVEALERFERAALVFETARATPGRPDEGLDASRDEAHRALRLAAAAAMDALVVERAAGVLPHDLSAEIDRWEEGAFAGTRADVELANYAIAELLGSPVRVFAPADDDEADELDER